MSKLVASKKDFVVNVQWGPRPETAEALATRWLALIQRLQAVDPLLADWMHWENGRGLVVFDPQLSAQVERILKETTRTRDGRLFPRAGTHISTMTNPLPRPKCFVLRGFLGRDYTSNAIIGETDYSSMPDPALITYDVMRGVLLSIVETFEATQGRVYPTDLRRYWDNPRGIGPDLDLAWISLVAPRFAPLVVPPPSVVAEHRPDGGLLMASSAETFSTDDEGHLAAAREIKAALKPFNAVPWTPETGK